MEDYLEVLLEIVEGPGIVFARMVAGEVCRCDVGDSFSVDANELAQLVQQLDKSNVQRTFRLSRLSCEGLIGAMVELVSRSLQHVAK